MPALASFHRRRKTAKPIKKPDQEDVWRRSLYVLGLETIAQHPSSSHIPTIAMATPTRAQSETGPLTGSSQGPTPPKQPLSFLDLPSETQKEIFSHVGTPLSFLQLFRWAKAASAHWTFDTGLTKQIYRSFYIIFPDEDDPSNDSPFDSLAGGFETFATSEYNYAQYLKELILETQSAGEKGERTYRHYHYDVSCGKFMNTLLLLTLRKAVALETFRWDIRVELSRPVFKALHQIAAIQNLHLRMQAGPSMYQPLPPLPTSLLPPVSDGGESSSSALPLLPEVVPVPSGGVNSLKFGNKIAKMCQKPPYSKVETRASPPTLSGFKKLKRLTVLDMDTLEYVDELRDCLRGSPGLSTLALSFSEAMVARSRKPQSPPETASDDDSDQEDELFGQPILPSGPSLTNPAPGAADPNAPTKIQKAVEEKERQQGALGRILGVENIASKPKPKVEKQKPEEDPKRRFIRNLAPVAAKLMSYLKPGSDITEEGQNTLQMIEKAARLYLDAENVKLEEREAVPAPNVESGAAKVKPSSSSTDSGASHGAAFSESPGLFREPGKTKTSVDDLETSNPDDIDVDEPEGTELAIEFETTANEGLCEESNFDPLMPREAEAVTQEPANVPEPDTLTGSEYDELQQKVREISDEVPAIGRTLQAMLDMRAELKKRSESLHNDLTSLKSGSEVETTGIKNAEGLNAELDEITRKVDGISSRVQEAYTSIRQNLSTDRLKALDQEMSEYVRGTRGLTLESLSIYLIPMKASFLSRGIDLNVLQSITLLNVGSQTPFWNLMAKENKLLPLPLHKVHTDHVTVPLLSCLSQLNNLTELILMERVAKDRGEGTSAKTTVTIEHIRKSVLRKHATTLRVLVVRNDTLSLEWDFNIKTMMLLCQRAKKLEELACSFGTSTMHTLLQYMPSLSSLRVLHTIMLHTDDNCTWVMREFRKFTVDAIAHNPDMKLEYLALDRSVDRLVRRMPLRKLASEKAKELDWTSAKALAQLVMGSSAGGWGDESKYDFPDSEDDEDGIVKTGLRVETIDGFRISDVVGIRIFEPSVLTGKL
ncbi:F-box domain-containing protein [Diplocarpon rosae]|nr:F-box domain-containing protein [Diplocarpon rosae]